MGALLDLLRRNEAQTFIRNAQIVRGYPACEQKVQAAREQIHRAMYRSALGYITLDERDCILSILAPCCPDVFSFESGQGNPYAASAFLDN